MHVFVAKTYTMRAFLLSALFLFCFRLTIISNEDTFKYNYKKQEYYDTKAFTDT